MNRFIQHLHPQQQVAFLLAVVLGVLLLCTCCEALWTLLKTKDKVSVAQYRPLRGLLRTSWFFASIFWLSWLLGGQVATGLFALISFFTLREFISYSPTKRADHGGLILVFFGVVPLQYLFVASAWFDAFTTFIPVYLFLLLPVVSTLGNDPHMFLERNAKLQWGVMVCVYGLSHVPALLMLNFPAHNGQAHAAQNMFLLLYLVLIVQLSMVTQHLATHWLKVGVGSKYRRAPSIPQISRRFHWLPWLLGVLLASLVGGAIAGITPFGVPAQGLALSFLASSSGTLGHLVMKAIKRDRGLTYWSGGASSITGAGGLLDHMDALCFAAPIFFHVIRWYYGL